MTPWSFSEHPGSVGETYGEHLRTAWHFGSIMGMGALACFIHGLFPFLFTRTGSDAVKTLHHRMTARASAPPQGMSAERPPTA